MSNFGDNRYELCGLISESSSQTIFRAKHLSSGEIFALTILHGFFPEENSSIVLEEYQRSNLLSALDHDLIARHVAFERWNETYYMVEEYVHGFRLNKTLQRVDWDPEVCVEVITQMAEALEYSHQQGVHHLAIQPENIIIATPPDGALPKTPEEVKVRLAGFGKSSFLRSWSNDQLPPEVECFSAPEQLGLLDDEPDARTDVYALGMLLYHTITGHTPYDSYPDLIKAVRDEPPTELRTHTPSVSESFARVVMRAISKHPMERFGSAEEFRTALASAKRGLPKSDPVDGESATLPPIDRQIPLIERDVELQRLSNQFADTAAGQGGLTVIHGPAGAGKTRLAEEFRSFVLASRGTFLWCQATEFERNRPFSPLREAIRQFTQSLQTLPEKSRDLARRRIGAAVGGFGKELLRRIPEAESLLPETPELVALDPEREHQRSTKTILNLFRALSGPSQPVVLFIDDYHLVDRGTRAVIEKLETQLGDTHLRLVYTEKEGTPKEEPRSELESSPTDGDSPETCHIHLPPISSGGCETMFEAGLRQKGKLVRDLSTIAYERCGGNPRLLIEIVKTLRQEFQSLKGIDSFKLLRLQTLITESQAEGYVRRRWDKLSSSARRVIAVAAVVGRKFTSDLVDKLADRPKNEVRKAIAEGLNQQIIASWNMLGEDWYCFAHDLVHDDVYASLPESTRLQLHRRLAETLEEESGDDGSNTYEIALHYLRGDDPAKAHRYTLQAARTAKAAYANREAIYFFSEALKLLPGQNDELELSILEDLGDACVLDGRYDSAKDHYQRVLALVSNRMHRARLEGKIGDMYFRRGMNESAIEHLKTGLAHLGVSLPRTTIGLYGSIALNVIRQVFHRCIPCSWLLLSNERRREICRLAVNSCHSLAYAYYFLDAPRTLCIHLRQLNLSERLGDSPELAHTYSSHGIVCSLIPLHSRAYRYQCAGLDVRKRLQDRWGIGQSNAFLGVCCYYRAELSRAIEFLRQSVRILESTGDQWEIEAAYSHLGFCFLLQGEVDAADEVNKSLLKLATEIQDLKFIAVAQTSLAEADLIRGNIDRALHLIDKALAVASENFNRAIAMRVRGQILLKLNRHDEARQCLNEALAIIRQGKLKNEYLVPNHIAIAEAELADVDRILAMGTKQRRRYLRRVEKHVRTGIAMASKFRNHLGYALRVRAVYHRLSGSVERAETDFIESEKILTEQGRLYELARTTLEWAHWKSRDGTLTELENVRGAREVFRKVGARLDLYDAHDLLGLRNGEEQEKQQSNNQNHQLSSLAKMSRSISSILDVDRLTLQFTDIAIEVTGGERGYLFLEGIDNKAEVFCARGSDRQDLPHDLPPESTPVINRAWHSGLAQVASLPNAKLTDETESTSVICVPLRAGEKTFGLIYIENALGPDAYTEQDIEFLTIFSSQAAVSLQNAYSYQTVEELNSNLDRKVRARTQELLEKKQEIENTNRLKSEFLANMSHELRTPLNAVIAMSEILVEQTFGELNDKQKTYLSHIIDSGVHLLDLINDVLDLSKIEAGQFDLQIDYFNLDDLLRRSLVVIKEKAAKKSVDLKFEPGTTASLVSGDMRRIKQVVFNLLSNAVKFTGDGGKVTLRTAERNDSIEVCVEDTGIGITREDQEIVFDEFRQVESSYSRRYEGTGLGLALCKKFIQLHDGDIWVESEPGVGSRFYFSLPVPKTDLARSESLEVMTS